jgi:hypothetical protein
LIQLTFGDIKEECKTESREQGEDDLARKIINLIRDSASLFEKFYEKRKPRGI